MQDLQQSLDWVRKLTCKTGTLARQQYKQYYVRIAKDRVLQDRDLVLVHTEK